jgi:hypothetical protein
MFTVEATRACDLVREAVSRDRWPEARDLIDATLSGPPPPLAALPLAACAAVGGHVEAALPGAADDAFPWLSSGSAE